MTLTKAYFIKNAHLEIGITNKKSAKLVEALIGLIKDFLENGRDVPISSFGKICVHKKMKRRGQKSATDGKMMLKRGRWLRLSVRGSYG